MMRSWRRNICMMMLVLVLATTGNQWVAAQDRHSVHLHCEAEQYFTVELNGVQHQSTMSGDLVIQDLLPGSYDLVVSLPTVGVEYMFRCVITDKSHAYSMKREVDDSWTLFDMVDFSETRGILASVWRKQEQAKREEAARAAKEQAKKTGVSPNIRKIFHKASSSGIDQVYEITNGPRKDTIAIFIPNLEETRQTGSVIGAGETEAHSVAAKAAMVQRRRYFSL